MHPSSRVDDWQELLTDVTATDARSSLFSDVKGPAGLEDHHATEATQLENESGLMPWQTPRTLPQSVVRPWWNTHQMVGGSSGA